MWQKEVSGIDGMELLILVLKAQQKVISFPGILRYVTSGKEVMVLCERKFLRF